MNRPYTLLIIACTLLLISAGSVLAFPVNVGDTIYFDKTYGNGTAGGQFDVSTDNSTNYLFSTFCLEYDEHLNLWSPFTVAGITDSAQNGGVNTNDGDPLSEQTKWLYWHFVTEDLNQKVSGYSYDNHAGANALQLAIWRLEEEITAQGHYSDTDWILASTLIDAASDALGSSSFSEGQVAVINLKNQWNGKAQDQLIAAPVPEPSTLLLLGSGLAGAALIHRRRKNKQ